MKIPTISDRDWLSRLVHIQFVPPTFYFNNVYFESNGWKSWRRFSEETQRRWNIVRRTMKFENKTLEDNFHSCIERWSMLIHWWIQLKILSQIKKNERISHTWRSSMKKNLLLCESNETDSSNLEIERSRYDEKYLLGQVREKILANRTKWTEMRQTSGHFDIDCWRGTVEWVARVYQLGAHAVGGTCGNILACRAT